MKWTLTRLIQIITVYVAAVSCFIVPLYSTWSRQYAGVFVVLGVGMLIVAVYLQQRWANYEAESRTNDLISSISMKRHDWLNHIQVMMGYVSLNKQDRLQSYMKRIVDDAEQESYICHLGYPPLTSYLITHNTLNQQTVLDIHIVPKLTVKNDKQGKQLLNTIREIERLVQKTYDLSAEDSPLKISMTLAQHESDIMLYVDLPDRSTSLKRGAGQQDWATFCKEVLSRNGEVFMEGEQVALECTVRIS